MLRSVGCTECLLDPALFYKHEQGELIGFVACHVDDFLHAGTQSFESTVMVPLRTDLQLERFKQQHFIMLALILCKMKQASPSIKAVTSPVWMTFLSMLCGLRIENSNDQRLLRQMVGKLNWAVQGTRPDVAFDLIQLSTKLKVLQVSDLIQAIKCMRKLKNGTSSIRFQNLGPSGVWRILVYSDASHTNLEAAGSVGAHLVFIVNPEGHVCTINWSATKIKRVVRSTQQQKC